MMRGLVDRQEAALEGGRVSKRSLHLPLKELVASLLLRLRVQVVLTSQEDSGEEAFPRSS